MAAEVIALFGPTGVGKTAVAVELAELLRADGKRPVAVSADALQVYIGLEALTGAAGPAERARLEHRLISFLPVDAVFSTGGTPIVVGGTGLYLRAAITELSLRPPPPEGIREHWTEELRQHGAPALHAVLARRAPWAAAEIAPGDRQRIVRSLELLDAGELEPPGAEESQLWTDAVRRPTLLAGLTMERERLYERIDRRVEQMLAAGAREEVLRAHSAGASITARKALGFEELLAGDVESMKRRTRNYSKRQLTWMRKLAGVHVIDTTELTPAAVAVKVRTLHNS